MQTTRLALENSQLPAALQLTAIAPGWAGKGMPQKPIGAGKSSELPAFVLPEGTFSIAGFQMVTQKHPWYHRAASKCYFSVQGFFNYLRYYFSHLPSSYQISVPGGWWPCCWQPLEDAPRALGGGSSRSGSQRILPIPLLGLLLSPPQH